MKNILIILISSILLSNSAELNAQKGFSIGSSLGGGIISGNTTSKGSFSSSIFIELDPGLYEDLAMRVSFLYHTDFNSVLPNTTKKYYPFLRGFGLKGITSQNIDSSLFVEEGLGLITLNDRTISGTNEWDYGVSFSIAAGFDLRNNESNGVKLSLGTEYGLTFFKTLPSYFSVFIQIHYLFL